VSEAAASSIRLTIAPVCEASDAVAGHPVGDLTRDEVLDNLTFYWLTNTAISSTRLYWENTYDFFGVKGVTIPAAVTVFPKEIYKAPRSWAERAYPNLIYFNEVNRAATSPPGRSRRCSPPSCAPRSGHCASRPYLDLCTCLARRGDRVAQLRATRPAGLRGHFVLVTSGR
jgi:hypothetical protein